MQVTGRSIAVATIDRQIAPLPLNSTLIWTLRASLPGRLGGPVASSSSGPANLFISWHTSAERDRVVRVLFKCKQRPERGRERKIGRVTY